MRKLSWVSIRLLFITLFLTFDVSTFAHDGGRTSRTRRGRTDSSKGGERYSELTFRLFTGMV